MPSQSHALLFGTNLLTLCVCVWCGVCVVHVCVVCVCDTCVCVVCVCVCVVHVCWWCVCVVCVCGVWWCVCVVHVWWWCVCVCVVCVCVQIITGEMTNVHFILDDPAGNSYIQVGLGDFTYCLLLHFFG